MKWALNTYIVGQNWELDELIEMAARTGYEGIEFLQDYGQKHGVEAEATAECLAEVKRKMTAAGLETASITSCMTFHTLDAAERRRNVEQAKRAIGVAERLDCPYVRVLGDRLPDDDTREAVFGNIADSMRELAEYGAAKGIKVSIEMHGSFSDPDNVVALMERVGHPNFGIVFNSQWRGPEDDPWGLPPGATSIRPLWERFAHYVTSVHLHAMEGPDVLPYYQEMFGLLKASGFRGYISNESAYGGPDPAKVLSLYTALFRVMTR